MSAAPMGRNKGGNRVTKLDRDTSKKNVALSKAKQRDALAAKNFVLHQKQVKKVKALQKFDAYVKASAKDHMAGVQQPKMYTAIVKDAGKVPKINTVKTMGDLTILIAMVIVLLRRILALKPAK